MTLSPSLTAPQVCFLRRHIPSLSSLSLLSLLFPSLLPFHPSLTLFDILSDISENGKITFPSVTKIYTGNYVFCDASLSLIPVLFPSLEHLSVECDVPQAGVTQEMLIRTISLLTRLRTLFLFRVKVNLNFPSLIPAHIEEVRFCQSGIDTNNSENGEVCLRAHPMAEMEREIELKRGIGGAEEEERERKGEEMRKEEGGHLLNAEMCRCGFVCCVEKRCGLFFRPSSSSQLSSCLYHDLECDGDFQDSSFLCCDSRSPDFFGFKGCRQKCHTPAPPSFSGYLSSFIDHLPPYELLNIPYSAELQTKMEKLFSDCKDAPIWSYRCESLRHCAQFGSPSPYCATHNVCVTAHLSLFKGRNRWRGNSPVRLLSDFDG